MTIQLPVRLLAAPGGSPPTRFFAVAIPAAAALCVPVPAAFHAIAVSTVAATAGYVAGAAARLAVPRYAVPRRWYELPTAALWALVAAAWHGGLIPWWWVPAIAFLAWLVVSLTALDLHHRRLPNQLTLTAFPVTLALLAFAASASHVDLLVEALLGALALTAFYALVRAANPEAIGMGDIKLAPTLGLFLGIGGPNFVLLGPLIASSLTLLLHCVRHASWRHHIPYGPGLLASTFALALPVFS